MRLQLALDGTLDDSLWVLAAARPYIDIAELGTPLILRAGAQAIREVRRLYPDLVLTADFKIMDAGAEEAAIAFAAGANIVTVLGVTQAATLAGAVEAARQYGGEVMVDLMQATPTQAQVCLEIGCDYLCVHTAYDQRTQSPLAGLQALRSALPQARLAVAGGIRWETLAAICQIEPEIVIVGSAITQAADPAAAAQAFRERIDGYAGL
jgi:3-hexulose-6-phosphate synthase